MKRILVIATCLVFAFNVNAKIHQHRMIQSIGEIQAIVMPAGSFGTWSATMYSDDNLTMVHTVRNGNSSAFRDRSTRTVTLSEVARFEGKNNFKLIAGFANGDKPNVIIQSSTCEQGQCDSVSYDLIAFNIVGVLDTDKYTDGFADVNTVLLDSCDGEKNIVKHQDGFVLDHGCGELTFFDYLGNIIADNVQSTFFNNNIQSSSVESARRIVRNDISPISEAINKSIIYTGLVIEEAAQSLHVNSYSGNGILNWVNTVNISSDVGSIPICESSQSITHILVICERDINGTSLFTAWTLDIESGDLASAEGQSVPHLDIEGDLINFSLSSVDDRQYGTFETDLGVTAINFSLDGVYVRHELTGKDISGTKVEEGGFYTVTPYYDTRGRYSLSFYDLLLSRQGPFFQVGLGGTFPSNQDFEIPVKVVDEDYLASELTLVNGGLPPFLEQREDEFILDVKPKHKDVGDYTALFTVTNPEEKMSEFTANYTVFLSDFIVNIFEPILFERLDIISPINVQALINFLGVIRVVEDEKFTATLSLDNRGDDEVNFSVVNLPTWLSFKDGVISGTPTQDDVGLYSGLTIFADDTFADPNEPGEDKSKRFNFPIEVMEVDETFSVTSNGEATITIGEQYNYQIEVDDEESIITEMVISGINIPSWMIFNEPRGVLSGKPGQGDVGEHQIDISIRDEGGYLVLHSFKVTVSEDISIKRRAGSVGFLLMPMLVLCVVIRRKYIQMR